MRKTLSILLLVFIFSCSGFAFDIDWTERQPAGDNDKSWNSVASDSDGSNLIAGVLGGRLWTSANSGVSWTERRPVGDANKDWRCVASDSDGSHLIAGIQNGRLWTSANSGVSWTERRPVGNVNGNWRGVASDSDGSNLIAGETTGRLYTGIEGTEAEHPTTTQLLIGGIWFKGTKQYSDWTRFKRGTTE